MRRAVSLIGWVGMIGGLMGISQVQGFGAPILKRHEVDIHVVSDGDLRIEERLMLELGEGFAWGDYFWEVEKEYTEGIRVDQQGIVSTMVDLARRGFLKIHELRVNGRKSYFCA